MNSLRKYLPISIIPLLIMALGVFMYLFYDPFYSRSIDPEFPYLVNGLNMAQLKFNYIGHIDHPGTPLQVFNGIVIKVTHLLSGKGNMVQDVFARPEYYLNAISFVLLFIQVLLTFIIGTIGLKRNLPFWQIAILQGTCFFNDVLIWLICRVNPDRFFIIAGLLFIIVYLKHGYEKRSLSKFALWSGVAMGLGMATKFNFLPVLLLPLLFIESNKNRLIYVGSGIASFFVFISPVITKFDDYLRFITSIFKHDGLYGKGNTSIISFPKMIESLGEIIMVNPGLCLLTLVLIAFVILAYRKKEDTGLYYVILFTGFLAIMLLQVLMVSKHFKNYYLTPVFILYGFIFFSLSTFLRKIITRKNHLILASTLIPILIVIVTIPSLVSQYKELALGISSREKMKEFVNANVTQNDIWFVEPTWKEGPYSENGLVYGLSFCGHRKDYLPYLRNVNPNTVTFEDNDELVQQWRCKDIPLDSIVATGNNIFIYSSPGRRAKLLLDVIKNIAIRENFPLLIDTVYSDKVNMNEIIKVKTQNPISNWHSKRSLAELHQKKVDQYVNLIKTSPNWLEQVRQKAILKKIPLDSMIMLDATYMANEVN